MMASRPGAKTQHAASGVDHAATKNLTMAEVAAWYGVSPRTIRRRIAEGRLKAYRVGPRAIRVSVEDLEAMAEPIGSDDGPAA
jgi:excisionase family DNA binding protein